MSSPFLSLVVALALLAHDAHARELRVCADPDNPPHSREDGSGFENRIAALVAQSLDARVVYHWFPERRGYLRKTLDARECDVVIGLPAGFERALTTAPYYRGTYVLAYRADRFANLVSLDDPRLRSLAIGVALVGNDLAATPPAHALAERGIVDNVKGYPMFGDGTATQRLTAALADGTVDVAILWGPQAGYFAQRGPVPIALAPLPFEFDIAMGVRRGDRALQRDLDDALLRLRGPIDRVLDDFAVVRAAP